MKLFRIVYHRAKLTRSIIWMAENLHTAEQFAGQWVARNKRWATDCKLIKVVPYSPGLAQRIADLSNGQLPLQLD